MQSGAGPALDDLFQQLASATGRAEAGRVEAAIWQRWTQHPDDAVQRELAQGIDAMNAGQAERALAHFDAVTHSAPDFAEGWNKRATLYYLLGRHAESIADIERTLKLEPRHFGALSGLALIREAQGRPFQALEALEQVIRIHPHMPQLEERIELLTQELGAAGEAI